ncbi:Na+/H+ antiporter NhaC family protein [Marinobacterium jannaschii]|uniref:Na+/H+ antiporter NhaC family protein n=1 Tax=Marinobacterium jannaschii TaxID=64970 RepID=UPI00056C5B66|nr:Na+/H+ antiporter NhaC family protein [Marinobacterium jannaschii]
MHYYKKLLSVFALMWLCSGLVQAADNAKIELPALVLQDIAFEASVALDNAEGDYQLLVDGQRYPLNFEDGKASVTEISVGHHPVQAQLLSAEGAVLAEAETISVPAILSLAPAFVAIVLALALKQVIPALFAGIWVGAALTYGVSFSGIWKGLLDTVSKFTVNSINDWGHVAIIIFSLMIGGLVGIISKNGGTAGIVNLILNLIKTRRGGQVGTAMLGSAIFFDDYANTLIVGNTMRPITDKLKISREKLAYIVDSTAAPVATVSVISTWVGVETGLIDAAVSKIDAIDQAAYSIFLDSLAYSYYPILAWLFVMFVAFSGRDFGPMYRAELAAQQRADQADSGDKSLAQIEDEVAHSGKAEARAYRAILPILVLLGGTIAGIYYTGLESAPAGSGFADVFSAGDSFLAMLWASLASVMVAGFLSLGSKGLTLEETIDAWFDGVRTLTPGVIVLVLAWSMSNVNDALHTSDYLTSLLGSTVAPAMLPTVIFLVAAVTAFATGTSWGVMGILMPLVIPLCWNILEANGMAGTTQGMAIFYAAVSSVMAGAVWGDHCSPISDTTVLASIASDCNHMDHVRTQMPYALFVGTVSILLGLVPAGFGVPWYVGLGISIAVLWFGLRLLSSRAARQPLAATAS